MGASRAIRAGAAYVEITARDAKLVRGLRNASKRLRGWSASVNAAGLKLLALGAAAAAPFGFAIKAASDMEETMNKFNVVFGESAPRVKKWGDNFAKQVGRSKKQVADFIASTQDLFVPLGFDSVNAEQMSKQITGLAVDLASFNNQNDSDVLRDLQSALTGSGDVMKKYGVIVNESAVKQELLNQGIKASTATNQQKVQARMNIILAGTVAAQGDAIRSAGSFANQMKALKARVDDAAVSMGQALLPIVTPLVTQLAKAAEWVAMLVEKNQEFVVMAAKVVVAIIAAGAALLVLGSIIGIVGGVIGGVVTAVGVLGTVLGAVLAALAFLVSPIGIVIALLGGLGAWFLWSSGAAGEAATFISGAVSGLVADVTGAFGAIATALAAGDIGAAAKVAWALIRLEFAKGISWIMDKWEGFKGFFVEVWQSAVNGLASVFISAWSGVQSLWDNFLTGVTAGWTIVTKGLVELWEWFMSSVAAGIAAIAEFFGATEFAKAAQEISQGFAIQQSQTAAERETALSKIGQGNLDRQAQIKAANSQQQAALADAAASEKRQRQAARDEKRLRLEQKVTDARAELDKATSAVDQSASSAAASAASGGPGTPSEPKLPTAGQLGAKFSSVGTFSARAVAGLGENSGAQDKIADATKKTADEVTEMNRKMPKLSFGK